MTFDSPTLPPSPLSFFLPVHSLFSFSFLSFNTSSSETLQVLSRLAIAGYQQPSDPDSAFSLSKIAEPVLKCNSLRLKKKKAFTAQLF